MDYNKLREIPALIGKDVVGLYIVQPNYLKDARGNHKHDNTDFKKNQIFRCGAVGTKRAMAQERQEQSVDASGKFEALAGAGHLFGRMMMYDSNWLDGGKIHAFLKLDRRFKRSEQNAKYTVNEPDKKNQTQVTHYEKEYHKILRQLRRVKEAKRAEWFGGDLEDMKCVLKVLATRAKKTLYLFPDQPDDTPKKKVEPIFDIYKGSAKVYDCTPTKAGRADDVVEFTPEKKAPRDTRGYRKRQDVVSSRTRTKTSSTS